MIKLIKIGSESMNKKGFAITTLIYGLSIMGILVVAILMGTMSTSRANNKALAKAVEKELNKSSKSDMSYDGSKIPAGQDYIEKIYVIPPGQGGWYRIECFGSSGSGTNANGAYTSGIIKLEDTNTLHFYLGKSGSGLETDVRIDGGAYDEKSSYDTRIMAAAGGSTSTGSAGGTLDGYKRDMFSLTGGSTSTSTLLGVSTYTPSNVPKTSRGIKGTGNKGDGYFPSDNANRGGVSYISGYGGGTSIIQNVPKPDQPSYQYSRSIYNADSDTYSYEALGARFYFLDGVMIPGVNTGAGRVNIEKISSNTTLPVQNNNLRNISIIYDCMSGTNDLTKITAIEKGIDRAYGRTISTESDPEGKGGSCKKVVLASTYNIDEISVFHTPGTDPKKHRILVRKDASSPIRVVKNIGSGVEKSETSTVTGYHISAYQNDTTTTLPGSGKYYILPVLIENKVLTGNLSSDNWITASLLNGDNNQKWEIEANEDGSYKIVELSKNYALEDDSNPKTKQAYKGNAKQKWKLIAVGNGTYLIQNNNTNKYLYYSSSNSKLYLSASVDKTTYRFRLIKLDFSNN